MSTTMNIHSVLSVKQTHQTYDGFYCIELVVKAEGSESFTLSLLSKEPIEVQPTPSEDHRRNKA